MKAVRITLLAGKPLTRRQAQVIRLYLMRWHHERIAKELGITVRGVREHLDLMRKKLGLQHRRELAEFCLRNAVIT